MKVSAVVLAGGRGSRLGGVRKAELLVDGTPLLVHVLAGVAGCAQRIVVGFPDLDVPAGVELTREDPPGAGPAAAIGAGVARIRPETDWLLVLACDQPGAGAIVPPLIEAARAARADIESIFARTAPDAAQAARAPAGGAVGAAGRVEWLAGIHRLDALRGVIAARGETLADSSVRRLFAPLNQATIPAPPGSTRDIDTWDDHEYWLERAAEGQK